MPKPQFKVGIKNKVTNSVDSGVLELYFLDVIEDCLVYDWWTGMVYETNTVADLINQVKNEKPTTIKCYIDSLGGDLGIAMSIYNFLKNYPAKVEVEITGMCMSAATVIAAAASKGKLTAPRNSFYVIHEASAEACGTAKDMREMADIVDRYTSQVADILSLRNTMGMSADAVAALWADGDCWMTGQEACDAGFIDSTYNGVSVTNRLKDAVAIYNNVTEADLMARIKAFEPVENTDEEQQYNDAESIKNVLNNFLMKVKNIADKFSGAIKNVGVTNKGEVLDLHTALAEPVTNMLNELEGEINTELDTLRNSNTTLSEANTALTAKLETLEATVANLVADAKKGKGGPSNAGDDDKPVKAFGRGITK